MPADRSRRAVLTSVALLPVAACAAEKRPATRAPYASPPPSTFDTSRFAALERRHHARLGVYALATGTGATIAYRADERFAFCSTFKSLAAAAVLHHNLVSHLGEHVTYTAADVNSISPVTEKHIATGMTIRALCDAAVRFSDGTAGNLLMRDLGGPDRLTAYLRTLGDGVSRMDDYEPELNRVAPRDPRDTTTPRALATDHRALVLGTALPAAKRALLTGWLTRAATGTTRIRAALPHDWKLAHKTGTGDYGRAIDVAVVWPSHTAPLVIALMSDRRGYHTPPKEPLIAAAARHVVATLT